MKINSLFNPDRKKELLKAVREGKGIFADKGQAEAPLQAPKDATLMEITSKCFFASNPPLIQAGARKYTPNEFLILAIEFGDLDAVKYARVLRADVNQRFFVLPPHPNCTDEDNTITGCALRSPLQFAKNLIMSPQAPPGLAGIVEFLIQNGAKD
jgi:hypothetical protein